MANLNSVHLIGRASRDPELRYTSSGTPVTEFSLAINREWKTEAGEKKSEAVFVDVTVWQKLAEIVAQYVKKGKEVYVGGRLILDTWQTSAGEKRSKLKVVANEIQFLGKRDDAVDGSSSTAAPPNQQHPPASPARESDVPPF